MDVKVPRGLSCQREKSSLLVGRQPSSGILCKFDMVGKCNRNPCRFLHSQPPTPTINPEISTDLPENRPRKHPPNFSSGKNVWISPDYNRPKISLASSTGNVESGNEISTLKTPPKVCQHWLSGNCVKGDSCRLIHSWFCGTGISMLAKLDGHKKAISGIALPVGSDKLYSGSRDGTVRLWDCHTGQCAGVINLGEEVGCLICEGPWIFIGMPNVVKAWNIESAVEFNLNEPVGQVYCMVVANEMLFAGAQDGGILVWKGSPGTENPFLLVGSLRGHSHDVTCLTVGRKLLYSGSMDNTIRVWELDTLQPVMTLDSHTDAPMSLLCWDQYLLSCSLDQTIKVWVATEGGNLEVTYTHNEEHGVLALCGFNDSDGQPVLLCACNDKTIHLYELPSFTERGRIFSKREVRAVQIGPDGLFFTDDGTGMLNVWKLLAKSNSVDEHH
ncbi:zinc finger CCCH domain-containing protein 48-like [Mangifera indica]|uniref:zinc finger CCCH domain-containing protein 48-like n=1 Tax=Mangifera indica TaxID=29780 RepID=UPI001CFB530B|nr:zinc finger CCCH domain-containing protein 48-like [Mangifera indica]XP_044470575.1 zinc finger CCCH domain-containing protein 48-like [Mangifera indica]